MQDAATTPRAERTKGRKRNTEEKNTEEMLAEVELSPVSKGFSEAAAGVSEPGLRPRPRRKKSWLAKGFGTEVEELNNWHEREQQGTQSNHVHI